MHRPRRTLLASLGLAGVLAITARAGAAQDIRPGTPLTGAQLVTGMRMTPTAAPGAVFEALNPHLADYPDYTADHAVASALSPDGRTLLVLTSGYNRWYSPHGHQVAAASNEYVFVYDISHGTPHQTQVLTVPDTFSGLAWNPDQSAFYVSGGVDDNVHVFRWQDHRWAERGPPIGLGHSTGLGFDNRPLAAGLAVDPQGKHLLVTNYENDSVSLVDLDRSTLISELDLRPGKLEPALTGVAGGEYPFDVVFKGAHTAYVSSQRDREIDVINISDRAPRLSLTARIKLDGQPNRLLLSHDGRRLYAASDNSDTVAVIDTGNHRVLERIDVVAPPSIFHDRTGFRGANPNNLALSPDGSLLFVTDGGTNAVAVIRLAGEVDNPTDATDDQPATAHSHVIGLLPTGWYPTAVSVSHDGHRLFVVNAKSPAGPNPQHCNTRAYQQVVGDCVVRNQYVWQLEKAGLLSLPMPAPATLARLTWQVAFNDHFVSQQDQHRAEAMMGFLREHIHHVIYIVKENRTYDQLLGDLDEGNGDPDLAILAPYSPNHHRWADQFVDLDNFYDSAETSNTGWNWSTAARATDFTEKTAPVNYARRGLTYDWEGDNRNVNVGIASIDQRRKADPMTPADPDLLPGAVDVAAPDGPDGETGEGYLWNSALRAGLTVRNYGFYGDLGRYFLVASNPNFVPLVPDPRARKIRQFYPTKPALMALSDPYYRGFDNKYPDYWRFREWQWEFDRYVADGNLPALSLVRLMHDHFGSFGGAIAGVDTVATQMADNDYAVARLVQRVAHSRYRDDTLIFILEDDAQAGADHVDAHRSVAFVIGPYVKRHALVSTYYTTVNLLRTVEDILGIQPLGLNDALARPMVDVFDPTQRDWTYNAMIPPVLRSTRLPLPAATSASAATPGCFGASARTAAYWSRAMRGQNFAMQDQLDTPRFNRALWIGLKGAGVPYPQIRDGRDLRQHRDGLLAGYRRQLAQRCGPSGISR